MYPPHAYGGYELSCRDVVERWKSTGHEVLVLTSDVRLGAMLEAPAEEGRNVRRELRLYWQDHVILRPSPGRRFAIERSNRRRLEDALSELRPDVVSAWAMGAMSMGLLSTLGQKAVPLVSVICDEWPVYGPAVDGWLRPMTRHPRAAGVVRLLTGLPTSPPALDKLGPSCFVSEHVRRVCRERSRWSFPESTVVYSGIEAAEFRQRAADPEWSWRLLYVGRIDPRKGIDTAVRALAGLPTEATLEICGRGDDRHVEELHRLVRELGLEGRVSFTSSERSELSERYAAADVVVFPPVWEEPFGLVPLEAMACGTPVVAAPSGGAAEFLVDSGNCLTFPPGDPSALVTSLLRLAGDPALRRRLVEAGRITASQLDVDHLAEVLEAWHLYAAGLSGSNRPPDRLPPSGLEAPEQA